MLYYQFFQAMGARMGFQGAAAAGGAPAAAASSAAAAAGGGTDLRPADQTVKDLLSVVETWDH